MFGENGTRVAQPCVVQVRIQRHQQTAPRAGLPSSFLVSIHEEASVITWQRSITIKPEVEQQLVDGVARTAHVEPRPGRQREARRQECE